MKHNNETICQELAHELQHNVTQIFRRTGMLKRPRPDFTLNNLPTLKSAVKVIVRAANGELDFNEDTANEVTACIQQMIELLCVGPLTFNFFQIDPTFWETSIGKAIADAQQWIEASYAVQKGN